MATGKISTDTTHRAVPRRQLILVDDCCRRLKASGQEETARLLIRAIYRLALAGVDVNARDARGRTALVLAAAESADRRAGNIDQSLLTHLLRIGRSVVDEALVQ